MKSNNYHSPNGELKKSFVFILNNIDVEGGLPIEVAPGHFFERANSEQIVKVKKLLKFFLPYGPHMILNLLPYEINILKKQGSSGFQHEPLSEDQWRYWIISFKGTNSEIQYIESAASILRNDLELGFTVLGESVISCGEAHIWHGPSLFSFFESQAMGQPAVLVNVDELREISENYDLVKKISPEHQNITRAFRKFRDLRSLPRLSELVIIGLFSIIESLVTHSPKLTESSDSLVHQIKTKIPLLCKKFQRELDYKQYFETASEETLWSKLYKYRSCIVHGEETNFNSDLNILKDRNRILEFIRETVKLLLLLALREPVLLTDLKKC